MPTQINHVTVIGAGTMGAAIAGHLANASTPVTLLDIAPTELTAQEAAAGLTLEHPKVRNRIVQAGFERMVKARPANLYSAEVAARIELGNLADDFERAVAKSDWIIEVIVEKAEPKQQLMARLEAAAPAHAIISSNTSGIPIHIISEGRSAAFKKRFMGTHFFNPPRYLHLLEVIPTADTDPALVAKIKAFAEHMLGKGVVLCKDTPNFIANRMFTFIESDLMEFAIENGYTVEQVDALTGSLIGRPNSATFRLHDIVGIDVAALVTQNLHPMIPHDEERDVLLSPNMTAVFQALLDNNLPGQKVGQGFYKTVVDEKGNKQFWGLDLQAAAEGGVIDYVAPQKPRWASVGVARNLPLPDRLRELSNAEDAAGELIWRTLARTMAYASRRVPEIADSLADIDDAMRWGFGWELGPFETWDVLGVAETTARMAAEGIAVAPWVEEMLRAGFASFYRDEGGIRQVYQPQTKQYAPLARGPLDLTIRDLRRSRPVVAENDSATLHDMGDGVLLLEFHSKMNALDTGIFELAQNAVERLHGDATGLVIGNEGQHFSVGANLFILGTLAQARQWQELEQVMKQGQDILMALRRAPKPVVAAPFQRVLGGGVEVCLAADRMAAHAESYMGLVEFGVGIVPGWGGCKEMVRRQVTPALFDGAAIRPTVNPTPFLRQVFETLGFAKVSTSALEARGLGFLLPEDRIVMNRDHLLAVAKQTVLHLGEAGYAAPVTTGNVYAAGRDMLASMKIEVYSLKEGGFISAHDAKVANKLASVLCGGDLSAPTMMDEQYFLDLEREANLSLAGEEKTQARIWRILETGKPLRN
ncbi:MAG: 3-hydroxyacyl-CoA dehydrogenase/enoyl-CoA hydratase family protein [Caldilineaceae bacterium]|nr:3-hydroxyacyl-CoA dehydrogenase/enoyl-CoA hydratase family protein [Caldilineaceae bacterium]